MKTAPEFIESISKHKKELFVLGEKVDNPAQHPILCPRCVRWQRPTTWRMTTAIRICFFARV